MVTTDQLITDLHVWEVVKVFYMIAFLLYVLFAVIIVRQIYLMTSTLNGSLNWPLKTLGFIHLILAAFLFLLAFVVL